MNELQRKAIKRMLPIILALIASLYSILTFLLEFRSFANIEIVIGVLGALIGGVIAYIFARLKDATNAPKIFISYAHQDKDFVNKLYNELQPLPFIIWWDQKEIQVGDDIKKKTDELLNDSDYLLYVISENSVNSDWAKAEIKKAIDMKKKVLPIVIDSSSPPDIIKNILYANFSTSFEDGMNSLVKALKSTRHNKANTADAKSRAAD